MFIFNVSFKIDRYGVILKINIQSTKNKYVSMV